MSIDIGIDPGVCTGFATYDGSHKALIRVESCDALSAMREVARLVSLGEVRCVTFEDARLRRWFGTKGREALQGAGSIKRDCQLWADHLERLGVAYRAVKPQKGATKLDAATFKRLTGWVERTNEHGRDAAMLVFQR